MAEISASSFHIGVAAEAFAAGLFARCGLDVSVQYGANQPEYDLAIVKGDKLLKISVKGSQDASWGLHNHSLRKPTTMAPWTSGFVATNPGLCSVLFSLRMSHLASFHVYIWQLPPRSLLA
jgi:hypothetical protein